jgi:exodeoxyribonuclease-3
MLKIATWNVNSIRVRLPQLLDWLNQHQPTLFALQETKVEDEKFPKSAIEDMGYHAIFTGQKSYNGVAILSREPAQEILTQLPNSDDIQKRFIAATYYIPTLNGSCPLRFVNLYVPNGESVASEKFQYKLQWLEDLIKFLAEEQKQYQHIAILGDFNIAPAAEDVYDPVKWEGRVLCSEPERAHFNRLISLGFCDAFRQKPQEPNSFSWWDYRTFAFRRNHGLRIDHVLITPALANAMADCYIDKNPRGHEQPSDHTPVVVTFKGTL